MTNEEHAKHMENLELDLKIFNEVQQIYDDYADKFIHADQDHRWKQFYDAIMDAYKHGMETGRNMPKKSRKKS